MSLKIVQSDRAVRPWSISRRLTLFYTASTAVLVMLTAVYLYWSQINNLQREDNEFLINQIQNCRRILQGRTTNTPLLVNEVQAETSTSVIKYYIRLLDGQKRTLLETPGMSRLLPPTSFPAATGTSQIPRRGKTYQTSVGETCLLMSAQTQVNPSGASIIQVALDVSEDRELIKRYRLDLLGVMISGSLLSWFVGAWVTRKGLQPLKDIAGTMRRITASQLHERIVGNGWPAELTSLAGSFDQMLDRLEDSFKRLSQFSADLAHELRTPINNLRGEAGVALSQSRTPEEYRRTLESSLEEFERLTRLIDNLLFLARADSPTTSVVCEQCDAREAIESVREFYEALAEDRGVKVRCEGGGTVNADPVLYRQAVSNLLSNALTHTSPEGEICVRLQDWNGNGLKVSVNDTGCGISPEHLPHIFDRFYRVDASRSQHPNGAGLGLSIVKSIMMLHSGSVEVQSEVGKGTRFTLFFPAASSGNLTKM